MTPQSRGRKHEEIVEAEGKEENDDDALASSVSIVAQERSCGKHGSMVDEHYQDIGSHDRNMGDNGCQHADGDGGNVHDDFGVHASTKK